MTQNPTAVKIMPESICIWCNWPCGNKGDSQCRVTSETSLILNPVKILMMMIIILIMCNKIKL